MASSNDSAALYQRAQHAIATAIEARAETSVAERAKSAESETLLAQGERSGGSRADLPIRDRGQP
jgi:hypothetical protein